MRQTVFMNICSCIVYAYLLDAQTCPGVDLNLEDVTGCPNTRSYICPGKMVQYECGNNISGLTAWDEDGDPDPSLFNCPANQNLLFLGGLFTNAVCGAVSGTLINTADSCSRTRVVFEATTSLNGTMIRCRDALSAQVMVLGRDEVVLVGTYVDYQIIYACNCTHIHTCTFTRTCIVVQTTIRYIYHTYL